MSLATIASKFEAFAAAAVADGKIVLLNTAGKVAADIESGFEDLVGRLGADATKLVGDLINDESFSGLEKANLAATQLTEVAANQGITLAGQDATTLIKNAYVAVTAALAKL